MQHQPGVTNLLDLLALFGGKNLALVMEQYEDQEQYGPLKTAVADVVMGFLQEFQDGLAKIDDIAVRDKLEADEKSMNETANQTLLKVQKAVGLRP